MRTAPSAKTAIDIFAGEWNSKLPGVPGQFAQGPFDTFNAPSIRWGIEQLGGVQDRDVVDLGSLEGGNAHMLAHLGARSVTGVEANTRAFLRCLIVKELYGLERVRFLCGDCSEYLRGCGRTFDVCVANGILYHLQNPVELLALAAQTSSHILLCTHYYDEAVIKESPIADRFTCAARHTHQGFAHTLYRYDYANAHATPGFSGGTAPFSHWLKRQDILDALRHFGFSRFEIGLEDPKYRLGPAFTVAASK